MMEKILKVHGSGNTFYLIDVIEDDTEAFVALAKTLCQPNLENGADGLLIVLPSKQATARMRVINADGSEASMCGNGLRCVARYVCEKFNVEEATIETMKVTLHVQKTTDIFDNLPTYAVEIAPISFDLTTLPMQYGDKTVIQNEILPLFSPKIPFTAVSVPNPHLIGIVNKHYIEHDRHQKMLAQFLNGRNDYCPDGVNVSYVLPLSHNELFVRTYERGVGFTNACGTAMTASALVSFMHQYVEGNGITVYNPGGVVRCTVTQEGERYQLLLTGNATISHRGQYEFTNHSLQSFLLEETDEPKQYDRLLEHVKGCIEAVVY